MAPTGQNNEVLDQLAAERAQREAMGIELPDSYWQNRREELAEERAEADSGENEDLDNMRQDWAANRTEADDEKEPNVLKEIGNDMFARPAKYIGNKAVSGARAIKDGGKSAIRFAKDMNMDKAKAGIKKAGEIANHGALSGYRAAKRNIKGVVSAAPKVAYKGAAGAAKVMVAGTVGAATWAVAAAATGDLSKATGLATTAGIGAYHGLSAGQGKVEQMAEVDTRIKPAFERGKYGSQLEAKEAKEQKAYEKSDELQKFLENQYKGKSKKEKEDARKAMASYNKYGIKDIEKQHKLYQLESKIKNNSSYMSEIGGKPLSRQEMASSYKARQKADSKAWTDDKVYEKEIQRQANRLSGNEQQKMEKARRKMAAARIMYDNRL